MHEYGKNSQRERFVLPRCFTFLLGGSSIFGSGTLTLNGWTHVALVRASGTTTLYVNGVASGTAGNTPNIPSGGFCIGLPGQGGSSENFSGDIDEVRVFTFAAGQ